ncbi:MAG: RHS repeat-associated core domain-containing protein [Candidatus Obscuribacterales bacterium]|nr:hypothetical protein [Cyanobacteria bacterium SZAS LIN-5]
MIKITYPGVNNYSTFGYDGLSRNTSILETTAGSITSTKQFVWFGSLRAEQREASGSLTKRSLKLGQFVGSSKVFYAVDDLGSLREATDSTGAIQTEYAFDPFGRGSKLAGTQDADFQYAGYYTHTRSNLNLTLTRAYSCQFGRWLSRDFAGERIGLNLYAYVFNSPVEFFDPVGRDTQSGNNCAGWAEGENRSPSSPYGIATGPSDNQTYGDYYQQHGWHCTPITSAKDCECKCNESKLIAFFNTYDEAGTAMLGDSDPMGSTPNPLTGWHETGYDPPVYPGAAAPPCGWTEIHEPTPNQMQLPTSVDPSKYHPPPGGKMWMYCCCKGKK